MLPVEVMFDFGYRGTSLMRNQPPPYAPTVGLCLGPYGDSRGVGVSYERGTPVFDFWRLAGAFLDVFPKVTDSWYRGASLIRNIPPP